MTFSIAARCTRTGQFGVAVTSSSPAVAARCAHVRAGVGAVCSQNVTDPRLGGRLLDLLADGAPATAAVHQLSGQPHAEWRQLTAIGAAGQAAVFSGTRSLGRYAEAVGPDAVVAGNLLADSEVPQAVLRAFTAADPSTPLGQRLVDALLAGAAAGGEEGPVHSAGLLIADDRAEWPVTDLRVDWTDGDPLAELAALWKLWEPQQEAYVQRALAPDDSPSYGVPGDPE
ncbi:DUF1028 domain-containing protein [Streptomyces sp. MZ04]|uniref:DUF1028 domain-containing protein n=1 Tax=Streptomyces sp. MZ04 TaxID=2559236 RepID=UPI00107E8ABC|nr:DUF1028 domain-containing protein [Streptomyces sp. MZ04]TGA92954.1 DUF1028 domain-containing protein [Streptomyces sp. MZ04]